MGKTAKRSVEEEGRARALGNPAMDAEDVRRVMLQAAHAAAAW
jgi:hypothetical protein